MNIVESIHQEVGIDLIAQILQLLLQTLLLKLLQLLLITPLAEIEFYAYIHAQHEDEEEKCHGIVLIHQFQRWPDAFVVMRRLPVHSVPLEWCIRLPKIRVSRSVKMRWAFPFVMWMGRSRLIKQKLFAWGVSLLFFTQERISWFGATLHDKEQNQQSRYESTGTREARPSYPSTRSADRYRWRRH